LCGPALLLQPLQPLQPLLPLLLLLLLLLLHPHAALRAAPCLQLARRSASRERS
jgi:hypothetical protein